jgi:hypothetical protein
MRRHIWIVFIVVGLLAWLGLGMGFAFAQSNVIYPVENAYPFAPIPNSQITISLVDLANPNNTSWLPEPGKQVRIQVKDASGQVITPGEIAPMPAVPNPITSQMFATSAYPGDCTNYGTSTAADFYLQGDVLTSYDNGGMAAVVVNVGGTNYNFIIPQDSNFDGIPDIYEAQYGGALTREGDIDTGPDPSSPLGDGIANIDEYRGFKVGEVYKRGDPTKKDLFVHLEETPQCTTGTIGTFTGQTGLVTLATFFPSGQGLYANVDTLPNVRVHRINNDEWVSKFSAYDIKNLVTLSGTDQGQDRWINKNSIASTPKVVKGVRIIECLDLSTLSPLGQSDKKPPDLTTKDNGNAILYTHRIVRSMLNLITGVNKPIVYYTFENGSWVSPQGGNIGVPLDSSNPSVSDPKVVRLMQLVLPWYLAHEALEHSFDVTATVQTSRKASYGYHHADGSGTNVDIKITNTLTNSANKFYIPKYFGISDEREMRVLSSQ